LEGGKSVRPRRCVFSCEGLAALLAMQ
jgi:hypothetical protein